MATPSLLDLADAVAALFSDLDGATFYRESPDYDNTPPPVDDYLRVLPYIVLHVSPGSTDRDNLAAQPLGLLWGFQINAVGGDDRYCLYAVEQVRARVDGRTLAVEGLKVGLMQPPVGAEPPPLRRTPNASASRVVCSLEYRVLVTPADPTEEEQ